MRLFTAALICVLAFPLRASHGQPLLLGGRAGATSATQHLNTPYVEYDRRHGLSAGLAATFEVRPWIALQIDALYTQKGARQGAYYEMHMGYLEAPVLARLSSPVGFFGLHPFLTGGLAPSVELHCSGYTQGGRLEAQPIPEGTIALNCDSQRRLRGDRGQVFGGGIFLDRGSRQFTFEVRRTRGKDIAGYNCCQLRNDVTSILVGASRRFY